MIETAVIQNFQSWKRCEIHFHKGVNVIIGQTDSGKTAIKRGIEWVATNRPLGQSFRSNWGGNTVVKLWGAFKYGRVSREIHDKPKCNIYTAHALTFKAMAGKVPPEITEALGFDTVNIQGQMDSPYLLSGTAGEVAKHFNRIANIDIIDKALTKSQSKITKLNQTIKQREEDLEESKNRLEEYAYLEKAEIDIESLEELEKTRIIKGRSINSIKKLVNALDVVEENIEDVDNFLKHEDEVNSLIKKIDIKLLISIKINDLKNLIKAIKSKEEKAAQKQALLLLHPKVETTLNKIRTRRELEYDLITVKDLVYTYVTVMGKGTEIVRKIESMQDLLPEVCPICNGTGKLK